MEFEEIKSVEILKASSLDEAILVWVKKPHVVDRRLCGASILLEKELSVNDKKICVNENKIDLNENNIDINENKIGVTDNFDNWKRQIIEGLKIDIDSELKEQLAFELRRELFCKLIDALEYLGKEAMAKGCRMFVRRLVYRGNRDPSYELIIKSNHYYNYFYFFYKIKEIKLDNFYFNSCKIF